MIADLPRLACNAHCHVLGPARLFPFDPLTPPPLADAPNEALFALNDRCGLERCVIVQSKVLLYDESGLCRDKVQSESEVSALHWPSTP